jgi:hypothetical protein
MMNRIIACLIGAAALVAAVPALAHGSRPGDGPQAADYASNQKTHELQEDVNILDKDINRDNRELTQDEQKFIGLEMQAAEAKTGKAAPLSPEQRQNLAELRHRIGNLDKDIAQEDKRLSVDETKLKALQDRPAP